MVLSGHNSNNYTTLITSKREICKQADSGKLLIETGNKPHRINQYGEKEVLSYIDPQKRLTPVEIAEIAEAYKTGESTYKLAKRYGCHRSSISNALKSVGITPRKGNTKNYLDEPGIISMYENNHTIAEIAENLKVDPHTIARCLKKNNIPTRRKADYFRGK